jgi:hypothetical protein
MNKTLLATCLFLNLCISGALANCNPYRFVYIDKNDTSLAERTCTNYCAAPLPGRVQCSGDVPGKSPKKIRNTGLTKSPAIADLAGIDRHKDKILFYDPGTTTFRWQCVCF